MEEKLYAVVDAAVLEDAFFELLKQEDPPSTCLYTSPDDELALVAPYLLQITAPVKAWLDKQEKQPWGYYLWSDETLINLRKHLKKYLQVIIPTEEKPVFLRFYDPRVIWKFLAVLDDWVLHLFMGPVDKITTLYPEPREETFTTIREQFPKESKSHRSMLTLTTEQYEILTQQELTQFKAELISIAKPHYNKQQAQKIKESLFQFGVEPVAELTEQENNERLNQLADNVITFCQQHSIDEDSAKTIMHLLTEREIYHWASMPTSWQNRLTNKQSSGHYNTKVLATLLQQEQEVR